MALLLPAQLACSRQPPLEEFMCHACILIVRILCMLGTPLQEPAHAHVTELYQHWTARRMQMPGNGPLVQRLWFEMPWKVGYKQSSQSNLIFVPVSSSKQSLYIFAIFVPVSMEFSMSGPPRSGWCIHAPHSRPCNC